MIRRIAWIICIGLSGVLLSCGRAEPPIGEVVITVGVGYIAPALEVQRDQWFPPGAEVFMTKSSGNPVVLQLPPGSYNLLYKSDSGRWNKACGFDIRQNREVDIAVIVVFREVRCESVVG
jgi:hypothetical protein